MATLKSWTEQSQDPVSHQSSSRLPQVCAPVASWPRCCSTCLIQVVLRVAKVEASHHLHSHLFAQGLPTSKESKEKEESAEHYLFGRVRPFFSLALKKEQTCFEAGGEKVLAQAGRKTQQELLLFILFNSIETLLLLTRCICFRDANKFQAITFA